MYPHHAPFFRFREVTRSLTELAEAQQVLLLKSELLHALEREGDGQRRCDALESELERLRAHVSTRSLQHQELCTELRRRLEHTTGQLARTQADGERLSRALRLEIVSMETECQTLSEICRSLLLTIERAACPAIDDAASIDPARDIRISAMRPPPLTDGPPERVSAALRTPSKPEANIAT